jgi:glutamate dehydrogenase/leucine dehydrogenase
VTVQARAQVAITACDIGSLQKTSVANLYEHIKNLVRQHLNAVRAAATVALERAARARGKRVRALI